MKSLLAILILFSLTCCSSPCPIDDKFRWDAVDPVADSLTVRLELDFINSAPDSIFLPRIDTLASIAMKPGAPRQLQARYEFWKGIACARRGLNREVGQHISCAISLCDSAQYSYDMQRFRLLESEISNATGYQYYMSLKCAHDYFSANSDDFMTGWVALSLGNLFISISDSGRASRYFFEADSLLKNAGADTWRLKGNLNNANLLCETGDTAASLEIIDRMLKNQAIQADTVFYAAVLTNRYLITGDTAYLHQVHAMAHHPLYHSVRSTIYLSLAKIGAEGGDTINARRHLADALTLTGVYSFSQQEKLDIYKGAFDVYRSLGVTDSVNAWAIRICALQDSILSQHNAYDILNLETLTEISRSEEKAESHRKIERMWILLGIAVILLAAAAALFAVYHRMQSHRVAKLRASLELEHERRRLVSSAMAITEKDNLIESVIEDLSDLQQSEEIPSRLDRLQQSLRIHLSGRQDWEVFKVMFDNVHPRFSSILKDSYPEVTEGDIRLAIYIRAGLTTKQISRMLLLQPDSVKKNRQRLRRHLHLDSAVSLEDFLRSISDTC